MASATKALNIGEQISTLEVISESDVDPITWVTGQTGSTFLKGGCTIKGSLLVCGTIYGTVSGGSGTIGVPTDGEYGNLYNFAQLESTDSISDALDKLNSRIELISPELPSLLSTVTLTLSDTIYSAYLAGTSTIRTNVQNNSNQRPETNVTTQFHDGDSGTLTAIVKNDATSAIVRGSITLSTADDTGIDQYLQIVSDSDPYLGVSQKEGIFKALTASIGGTIVGTLLTPGDEEYSYQLSHSDTGSTNILTFRQDDAFTSAPSVSSQSITGVTTAGTSYVSGVPVLATTDTIEVSFQVINVVKKFYHISAVGEITSSYTAGATFLPTGVDRNEGASPTFNTSLNILANVYTESLQVTCIARNSAGTTSNAVAVSAGNTIRIDTASLEASSGGFLNESVRKSSGTGQFPVYSGTAFDPSVSIAGNEELQLINKEYQYPPAVDYSSFLPAGPDYSALAAGSFSTVRWVTFELSPVIVSESFITLTIENPVNIPTSSPIIPDFYFYVLVDGSGIGWLDGNTAYSGVGTPSSNGDAALDFSGSTYSDRRITFGPVVRSGTVIVRIGLPEGSTYKFSGITMTLP